MGMEDQSAPDLELLALLRNTPLSHRLAAVLFVLGKACSVGTAALIISGSPRAPELLWATIALIGGCIGTCAWVMMREAGNPAARIERLERELAALRALGGAK